MLSAAAILMSALLPVWSNLPEASPYQRADLGAGGGGRAYLSREQNDRLERLRHGWMLFSGQHRQYYLHEGRTQFHFPPLRVNGRDLVFYTTTNLLKRFSVAAADLLFGEEPALRVEDKGVQQRVQDVAKRSRLTARMHRAAVQASWAGGAFVEVCRFGGEVYVANCDPRDVHPAGDLRPDGQYAAYERFRTRLVPGGETPIRLLLIERYEAGSITRELWQLSKGGSKLRRLTLDQWPAADKTPLADVESTGVASSPTMVYVPNNEGDPASDYDGDLVEMQDKLNAKESQISRVLAKFSDPKLLLPEDLFDHEGNVPSGAEAFPFREGGVPQYLVWNAELETATKERDRTMHTMCVSGEFSPVLLGIKEGAAPDAARKLRLEATSSLAKAARKANAVAPAITRLLEVAQEMDRSPLSPAYAPTRVYAVGEVGVELRDGLPVDDLDVAQAVATYRSAGVMSRRRGVERQLQDPDAVDDELKELEDEAEAAMPSVFMGGGQGQNPAGREPGEAAESPATTEGGDL